MILFSLGLASVEAYSYKTNEWFFVAPMNTRRSSVGVGVVEGKEAAEGGVVAGPALTCGPCPESSIVLEAPIVAPLSRSLV